MDLYPDETEEAIRAASADFLSERMPLGEARARPHGLWREMAELGWFGIALAESKGGLGLGHGCEALVFAELGRHLAPIGVIAATLGASIAGSAGDDTLVSAILAGKRRLGLALPENGRVRVIEARQADGFVLVNDEAGAVYARGDADWQALPCLDPSTRQTMVDPPCKAPEAIAPRMTLHQQVLSAAYALGIAEAARNMAASYAATREQFGRPIGAFQGIKHPCADMAVRASAARAQLLYAALALDQDSDDKHFQVAAAKRLADEAAIENARMNVQVHGGIGMTDEADVHLLLKRAHLLHFIAPATRAALLA